MSLDPLSEARLGELAERHKLTDVQVAYLRRLLDVLDEDPTAPSAVRDPARALDVHVADSLSALDLEAAQNLPAGALLADIGAGAGLPGLVLAVALPAQRVLLVESQSRKCAFLHRAVAALDLLNAGVRCTRVEEWEDGRGACAVVTARALAPQPVVLEYAAPLLEEGGAVLDWRGERRRDEEAAAGAAASELGLILEAIVRTDPFAGARDHHIHVFRKVAPTPERYPRRPGIARKRPLGG